MKLKFLATIGFAATLYSCDDATSGIGDFLANTDEINAYSMSFKATTNTIKFEDLNPKGVYSRTNSAYLGKFTDMDFGTFSADFITQINCPENYSFPDNLQEIEETTLELYYNSFYGDPKAPMRVRVASGRERLYGSARYGNHTFNCNKSGRKQKRFRKFGRNDFQPMGVPKIQRRP